MSQKSYDGKATLYLIPTPIGNMDDITVRALKILEEVSFVLCEDTRVSWMLLNHFNIKKTLVRCDEYSQEKVKSRILNALSKGENIGLVSDAGSPVISDPGYVVAKYVIEAGYNVVALPGATAFVPALSVSGLNPAPFIFYGFLNAKNSKLKNELELLKEKNETLIFYESPRRIVDTLNEMLKILGDRNIAICREITKLHEEIIRGKISECINSLDVIKGEFVIVVDGYHDSNNFDDLSVVEHVNIYIKTGYSVMDSIKKVAKERNVAKSIIYKEYNDNK